MRQQLAAKGAGPEVQAYVEQVLLERHQSYNSDMTAEADKRRVLIDHVNKLEVMLCLHMTSSLRADAVIGKFYQLGCDTMLSDVITSPAA